MDDDELEYEYLLEKEYILLYISAIENIKMLYDKGIIRKIKLKDDL